MQFGQRVLAAVKKIPYGKITTYRQIAAYLGRPKAARAVGNALHKNPLPRMIPCHRVVKSDGCLGGYVCGLKAKAKLLSKEGISVKNGKIIDFRRKLFNFRSSYKPNKKHPM